MQRVYGSAVRCGWCIGHIDLNDLVIRSCFSVAFRIRVRVSARRGERIRETNGESMCVCVCASLSRSL